MKENNIKIELFTKKAKIITVITCVCAVFLVALNVFLSFKIRASIGCNESVQSFRTEMWRKIFVFISFVLSHVLLFTGPAYQVISDNIIERKKLKRYKVKNSSKNRKRKKGKILALNLTVIFIILLAVLTAACAAEIIPMIQDISGNSYVTYDGLCTVISTGAGNPRTMGVSRMLLNESDIRVKGSPYLDRGEYYAHVVYAEKSKYIVYFSLMEEEPQ